MHLAHRSRQYRSHRGQHVVAGLAGRIVVWPRRLSEMGAEGDTSCSANSISIQDFQGHRIQEIASHCE